MPTITKSLVAAAVVEVTVAAAVEVEAATGTQLAKIAVYWKSN